MFSYWEKDFWSSKYDFAIVGAGFTGLNVAINLKRRFEKANILVLDKNVQFAAASTKNAGFACFGSPSEILHDMEIMGEEQCYNLIERRKKGIEIIAHNFDKTSIEFTECPASEWFLENNLDLFTKVESKLEAINSLLGKTATYAIGRKNTLQKGLVGAVSILGEGQLNPAKLHAQLLLKAQNLGIGILNNARVEKMEKNSLEIEGGLAIEAKQIINCTNGLAKLLNANSVVQPARAQVLITSEIANLPFHGNYHMDEGYYYFRNVGKRLLLGGARNLDFEGETTFNQGLSEVIQNKLANVLQTLLPNEKYTIEHKWSGIMGMRQNKNPIIEVNNGIIHLVGMSGMGVALAFSMSQEMIELC